MNSPFPISSSVRHEIRMFSSNPAKINLLGYFFYISLDVDSKIAIYFIFAANFFIKNDCF